MNATATAARRIVKARRAQAAAEKRARRAVAADGVQTMRTHLVARGLDIELADRFAGAASRKAGEAHAMGATVKKLKGRRTRRFDVKLFTPAQVDAVLVDYRPRNVAAAYAFYRLAA